MTEQDANIPIKNGTMLQTVNENVVVVCVCMHACGCTYTLVLVFRRLNNVYRMKKARKQNKADTKIHRKKKRMKENQPLTT